MLQTIKPFTLGTILDRLRTYPDDARVKVLVISWFQTDESMTLDTDPDGVPVEEVLGALSTEDPDTPVKGAVLVAINDGNQEVEWYAPIIGGADADA